MSLHKKEPKLKIIHQLKNLINIYQIRVWHKLKLTLVNLPASDNIS